MILSSLLSVLVATSSVMSSVVDTPNATTTRCYNSVSQRQENVPPNTSDEGHSVAHAAAIFSGDSVVAWLYQDRDKTLWFQGNSSPLIPRIKIEQAAQFVGFQKPNYTNSNPVGDDMLRGYALQITKPISLHLSTKTPLVVRFCW